MATPLDHALHGLSAEELADLTHSHVTTARRWLRARELPPVVGRCLTVLRTGDLGGLSAQWNGWTLRGGQLISPEGSTFTPGDVRAGPLHAETARLLRGQLHAATETVEGAQDRRVRVEALAALENALAAAHAAVERLGGNLTDREQDEVFDRLESTQARRRREKLNGDRSLGDSDAETRLAKFR